MKSWCDISTLNRAAHACIKHKHSRRDAVAFRMHWGEEILSLARRRRAELLYEAPWSRAPLLVQKSISQWVSIAVAVEELWLAGNVKMRRFAWLMEPPPSLANPVEKSPKRSSPRQLCLPGFEKWLLTSKGRN